MKRLLVFLLAICLSVPPRLAAFPIPKNCHICNESPGYCAWVSLEILGRAHGIEKLHGLFTARKKEQVSDKHDIFFDLHGNPIKYPKHLGYNFSIRTKLKALGVRFWMQDAGNYSRDLLKYAGSHGCVVAVKSGAIKDQTNCHAIILTHYDDKTVQFFDCNTPDTYWEATREWFDYYWTGLVVVVEKDK